MLCKYLLVIIASIIIHVRRVLLFTCMCHTNIYAGTYLTSGFHIALSGGKLNARRFTVRIVWV